METYAGSDGDITEQESLPGDIRGFAIASYFYLVVSAVTHLNDSALVITDAEIMLASTPDMLSLQLAMLGLLVLGGGFLTALHGGRWWGWIGAVVVFSGWAMFTAVFGKVLTAVIAIVCVGYLITRAGYYVPIQSFSI